MRQQKSGGTTVASVGSMTAAIGAQRALARAAIRSEIVKMEESTLGRGSRGCSYGVSFPAAQQSNAQATLSSANIRARFVDGSGWQSI